MEPKKKYIHESDKGLRLPVPGAPGSSIQPGPPVTKVAVTALDYLGIRPRMAVEAGTVVQRGQLLFEDRRNPGVRFTSPASGTVSAVHRGDHRALLSVVIDLDAGEFDNQEKVPHAVFDAYLEKPPQEMTRDQVRDLLVKSGLWTAFRRRPFDNIPRLDETPHALFVMAVNPHPSAPSPTAILEGRAMDFEMGLVALRQLLPSQLTIVCTNLADKVSVPTIDGVETHSFGGPFPVGTPGFCMHILSPPSLDRPNWYLALQDVLDVGALFRTGRLSVERVISLAGPEVQKPALLRTRIGACISELTDGRLSLGNVRVLAGSVLDGRETTPAALDFLGRYHLQISVLKNATDRHLLGWLGPGRNKFSVTRLFLSRLLQGHLRINTDAHGGRRAMVPMGFFEKVWPFDLLVTPLLRALSAEDDDTALDLGCMELAEEDVAVCTFVCPSKIDYGLALRAALTRIEEAG